MRRALLLVGLVLGSVGMADSATAGSGSDSSAQHSSALALTGVPTVAATSEEPTEPSTTESEPSSTAAASSTEPATTGAPTTAATDAPATDVTDPTAVADPTTTDTPTTTDAPTTTMEAATTEAPTTVADPTTTMAATTTGPSISSEIAVATPMMVTLQTSPPSVPRSLRAVARGGAVALYWAPPSSPGTSAIGGCRIVLRAGRWSVDRLQRRADDTEPLDHRAAQRHHLLVRHRRVQLHALVCNLVERRSEARCGPGSAFQLPW